MADAGGADDDLLDTEEVLRVLRLAGPKQLKLHIDRGHFPRPIKLAHRGKPLWLRKDVRAFLHLASRGCFGEVVEGDDEGEEKSSPAVRKPEK